MKSQVLPTFWSQWLSLDQCQQDAKAVQNAMARSSTSPLSAGALNKDAWENLGLAPDLQARLRIQGRNAEAWQALMGAPGDFDLPGKPAYGDDIGVTPGRIVWRGAHAELVHYSAADSVGPALLWVPAPINKHVILDLCDGRSVIARQLELGLDVYALVWRGASNDSMPTPDDLVGSIVEAAGAVAKPVHLAGYCLGGVFAAMAALDGAPVRSLSLVAAPMDGQMGELAAVLTPAQRAHTKFMAEARGLVPAAVLSAGFMALKPESWKGLFSATRPKALTQWLLDGLDVSAPTWHWIMDVVYGAGAMSQGLQALDVPIWVQSFDDDHLVMPQQLTFARAALHARAPGGHNGGLLRVQPGQWLDPWVQWLDDGLRVAPTEHAVLGQAADGYLANSGSLF